LLEAGQSVVAESAFQPAFDVPRLKQLQENYRFRKLELFCTAETEILLARFLMRAHSSERHPGHGEQGQAAELRAKLEGGIYGPLGGDDQVLMINTTNLAVLDDQHLYQTIRTRASIAEQPL
jgi:hypothetical protein